MNTNDLRILIASELKLALAQMQTAPAPAPVVVAPTEQTVEAVAKPARVYPSLAAIAALGYAVPAGATMAVLTSTGKLWYYAVLPSGAREEFDSYHAPSKRECAALRAQFAHTAPQA